MDRTLWLLPFACCVSSMILYLPLALLEVTLWLRSKLCPIAAGRSFFSAVALLSRQGFFRLYHLRLVSICFALWDALHVIFRFVCPKLYLVHLVRPFRKSVSTLDSDVGGLYVIVYRWCWSITLSFPLFSHMFHYSSEYITLVWCPSVVFEKWGRSLLPMGAYSSRDRPKSGCQSFSLERHLLSRWLRLLMLPPAVTVFHLHNLLCSISLSRSVITVIEITTLKPTS